MSRKRSGPRDERDYTYRIRKIAGTRDIPPIKPRERFVEKEPAPEPDDVIRLTDWEARREEVPVRKDKK